MTLHGACPVLLGFKWGWLRSTILKNPEIKLSGDPEVVLESHTGKNPSGSAELYDFLKTIIHILI